MNSANEWSRFVVRINIRSQRQQLYAAWATRAGMESWFLRSCEFARPDGSLLADHDFAGIGDRYTFLWHGWPDETVEHGEILEANGHDLFKFSFGQAGNCTVRILLAGEEQIVELEQTEIPTDDKGKFTWHIGCRTGWTFYLTNLKSILEGGIDLRNRDEHLQNMINA
ncbi:SRPBCC family protein [Flavihumibacter fluvii]|uniref:SRPBCC family protein n=1 Tax=Flavihumibacter fluvii TaxID=2838157 RepID=UPI001BDE2093|nr:SRPBCC domain-containing protein [Flavihumibacter fluvii]ULQ51640.1 SRPBCC domain-containing protein [Flavihumibacter fluvii]